MKAKLLGIIQVSGIILFFFSTVHAADIDSVFEIGIPVVIIPSDGTTEMYQALANEGLNGYAQLILLKHAKMESHYGTKGVARKNGYNWWNCTTTKTYKGKKRVAYEWEHGRRIKKYWYVWDTPEEASKGFIKFLRRRYKGALTEASNGDWEGYMRILRRKGYFGKAKSR